jgi:hypothetical protein
LEFSGFGEITFDKPKDPTGKFDRGSGKYWEVDEARPKKTIVKPITVRRVTDTSAIEVMTAGGEHAVRSLITRTLKEW